MHARSTTIQAQPERLDEMIRQVQDETVPLLQQQDGFKGFTLHVNRSSGKVVGTSYWDSVDALEASEAAVRGSRESAGETGGGSAAPSVEQFEVVLDTMA